jgi:hypothetical protein
LPSQCNLPCQSFRLHWSPTGTFLSFCAARYKAKRTSIVMTQLYSQSLCFSVLKVSHLGPVTLKPNSF